MIMTPIPMLSYGNCRYAITSKARKQKHLVDNTALPAVYIKTRTDKTIIKALFFIIHAFIKQ